MKKHFFIFVGLVFCAQFSMPAFGASCSCDALIKWKSGNIDDFLQCSSIKCGEDTYTSPLEVAISGKARGTGFHGNYDAVKAILEKKPELAKKDDSIWKRPVLQQVIENCCVPDNKNGYGKNRTGEIANLLIEKNPEVLNYSFFDSAVRYQTLLDHVIRWKKSYDEDCQRTGGTRECEVIEKLLIEKGAKTCAELHCESASRSVTYEVDGTPVASTVVPTETKEPARTNETKENNADKANTQMNLENIQPVSILSNVPQENLKTPAEIKIETQPQLSDKSKQEEQKKKDSVNQNGADEENTSEEKQKAYDEAKAKEQSTENKLLGGLTTAATGIGGMQALQGLAEQSSDKDAAADMAAYIETMRCTYGDGQQVKAGPEEIELPGANDEELMKLRNEYLALAADLKERKEALGMKPGIESEVIMDRAQTGLYDDENVGITSGNYASLYRAQALKSETDQAKIDDASKTSSNRVKYGAIAAGAGVVGGIVGNQLINDKSEKNKNQKTEENTQNDKKSSKYKNQKEKEEHNVSDKTAIIEKYKALGVDVTNPSRPHTATNFELDGDCGTGIYAYREKIIELDENNTCEGLTTKGTFSVQFDFGLIYGQVKCKYTPREYSEWGCFCKIDKIGQTYNTLTAKKTQWWEDSTPYATHQECEHLCSNRCARTVGFSLYEKYEEMLNGF